MEPFTLQELLDVLNNYKASHPEALAKPVKVVLNRGYNARKHYVYPVVGAGVAFGTEVHITIREMDKA